MPRNNRPWGRVVRRQLSHSVHHSYDRATGSFREYLLWVLVFSCLYCVMTFFLSPTRPDSNAIQPSSFNDYFDIRRIGFESFCGYLPSTPVFIFARVMNKRPVIACDRCNFYSEFSFEFKLRINTSVYTVRLDVISKIATLKKFYLSCIDRTPGMYVIIILLLSTNFILFSNPANHIDFLENWGSDQHSEHHLKVSVFLPPAFPLLFRLKTAFKNLFLLFT